MSISRGRKNSADTARDKIEKELLKKNIENMEVYDEFYYEEDYDPMSSLRQFHLSKQARQIQPKS